jgi:hypothetical protein
MSPRSLVIQLLGNSDNHHSAVLIQAEVYVLRCVAWIITIHVASGEEGGKETKI